MEKNMAWPAMRCGVPYFACVVVAGADVERHPESKQPDDDARCLALVCPPLFEHSFYR